jgi:carbonic anhydrase
MTDINPLTAFTALEQGNERFVAGRPTHPNQDVDHRASVARYQHPTAVVFGCSDSRVAAELIFDQGLGDVFVVRTAGHVIDSAVLGSIEFATTVLDVPLIAVLGHDSCGAVTAALSAVRGGDMSPGYVRNVVERVTPSVLLGLRDGLREVDQFVTRHVVETVCELAQRSSAVAEGIAEGSLAVVGLTYRLTDGRVTLCHRIGELEGRPELPS